MVIAVKNLANHVNMPIPDVIQKFLQVDKLRAEFDFPEIEAMLVDCGGNPQILVMLLCVLAGINTLSAKMFDIQFYRHLNFFTLMMVRDFR